MSVIISKCTYCKHFNTKSKEDPLYCDAYPNGIPEDFFWDKTSDNEVCHNDIGFEELKD